MIIKKTALIPGMFPYPLYRQQGGHKGRPGLVRKMYPIPGFGDNAELS